MSQITKLEWLTGMALSSGKEPGEAVCIALDTLRTLDQTRSRIMAARCKILSQPTITDEEKVEAAKLGTLIGEFSNPFRSPEEEEAMRIIRDAAKAIKPHAETAPSTWGGLEY